MPGWRTIIGLFLTLVLGLIVLFEFTGTLIPPTRPPEPITSGERVNQQPTVLCQLRDAGWNEETAKAIVAFHGQWFDLVAEENPDMSRLMRDAVIRLGRMPAIHAFVAEHPELLGLLAMGNESEAIVQLFRADPTDFAVLLSVFMLNSLVDDHAPLVRVLQGQRELIVRLYRRGIVGVERLFTGGETQAERVFDRWLADELRNLITGADDDLAAFLMLVHEHRSKILKLLESDTKFRDLFASELWPRLCRATSHGDNLIEAYLDSPHIWDVLSRSDGERLLRERGLLAVPLFFGPDAYPQRLHDRVSRIMLDGDETTCYGLILSPFRREERFHRLLESKLTDRQVAGVINDLVGKEADYPERLHQLFEARNQPEKIDQLVSPPEPSEYEWLPLYYHFRIVRKVWSGEEITNAEWQNAGVDTVLTFYPPARAAKLLKQSLRAGKSTALLRNLKAPVVALAPGKLVAPAKQLDRWEFPKLLKSARQIPGAVSDRIGVDITKLVQASFRHSGIGRGTWKWVTGLEARVFMRRDGVVTLQFDQLAMRSAQNYLRDLRKSDHPDTEREIQAKRAAAIFWLQAAGQLRPVPIEEAP